MKISHIFYLMALGMMGWAFVFVVLTTILIFVEKLRLRELQSAKDLNKKYREKIEQLDQVLNRKEARAIQDGQVRRE